MAQPCPALSMPEGWRPGGSQGRGEGAQREPVTRCPARRPAGADGMSDCLEEAAGHAAPSGGAIVDHTKDGAAEEWTDKQEGCLSTDSGLLAGASVFVLCDLGFRAGIWFIASWGGSRDDSLPRIFG